MRAVTVTQAPGSRLPVRRGRSPDLPGVAAAAVLVLLSATLVAQPQFPRAAWNEPQKPFRVFGNTYWVGTHGLGSVLITSDAGHVLIDGALPESVPQITGSIRTLGFKVEDVKLIVNSHVHFDHAGGISELQRLSGARVVASPSTAAALMAGASGPDDPQFGIVDPIARVASVATLTDGETLRVGPLAMTAHLTPGHTPGGTSWSWRSCESARCVDLVYADSLNPISNDRFKYTSSPLLRGFETSYAALEALPCDILLTPHPGFSEAFEKLAARDAGKADAFIDPGACKRYVAAGRKNLAARVATEAKP